MRGERRQVRLPRRPVLSERLLAGDRQARVEGHALGIDCEPRGEEFPGGESGAKDGGPQVPPRQLHRGRQPGQSHANLCDGQCGPRRAERYPVRLPNERSAVGRTRPVACSASTRPAISAASTLRQATKRAARHEKPKSTQNGSGRRAAEAPDHRPIWARIGRVRVSAMAAAAEESTSTPRTTAPRCRPRLAPSGRARRTPPCAWPFVRR